MTDEESCATLDLSSSISLFSEAVFQDSNIGCILNINFVFINIINVLSNSGNVKTILMLMFRCFFDLSSFVESLLCSADWGSIEPQETNIILKKFIKNLLNVNLSAIQRFSSTTTHHYDYQGDV